MNAVHPHTWKLTVAEAIRLQKELSLRVLPHDSFQSLHHVAGVDISVTGGRARAAAVVLTFPGLQPVEEATAERAIEFPYVPGLLAFREIPAILDALSKLRTEPDLILADAQGLAHPRRFGLACHLGVLLDKPTIGCAKSRLRGRHDEPSREAGSWAPLLDRGETIGAALRTKSSTRVIYVSVGHRVSLESAIRLTLGCCTKYRLPEPTRLADRVAGGGAILPPLKPARRRAVSRPKTARTQR